MTEDQPTTSEPEFHPLANLFPLMEGEDFDKLVQDIREHGLREPITLHEGKVLDGRNRHRACIAAGKGPRYRHLQDDDPLSFVISRNRNPPVKAALR